LADEALAQRFSQVTLTLLMNRRAAVPGRSRSEPPGRVKVWTGGAIADTLRLGTAARRRFRGELE